VLGDLVTDDPAAFATSVSDFAEVDPAYARALLRGLDGALEAGQAFAWRPVLRLIALIGEGRGGPEREDQVPLEQGEASREPESLALNSVRCPALRVVIVLAERRREVDANDKEGLDSGTAALLEAYLDPDREPSPAVRSIFGWYYGKLMFCDREWAIARVPTIFPTADERLWRAAWESFVMRHHAHDKLLEVLESNYRRAIEEISTEKPEERLNDPDEALIVHLFSYYLWGLNGHASGCRRALPGRRLSLTGPPYG
jgi:hypothetical protein